MKITLLAQELCARLGERGRRGPHLQRGSGPSGLQPGRGFIFSRLRGGRPPPADCGRFRGFSGGPATWAPCPQRQRVPSPALLSVWQRTRSLPGATHGPPRRPPRALTEKCLGWEPQAGSVTLTGHFGLGALPPGHRYLLAATGFKNSPKLQYKFRTWLLTEFWVKIKSCGLSG